MHLSLFLCAAQNAETQGQDVPMSARVSDRSGEIQQMSYPNQEMLTNQTQVMQKMTDSK